MTAASPEQAALGYSRSMEKRVGSNRIERTIPFIFGVETADVGMDLYSAVTPDYAKGENQFTRTIKKVTIDLK